jgi:hypothetical protein
VAPLVEEEDSYYLEHRDNGEELNEAYKTLYVEYEKLREGHKQHLHDLNSLQTEKSSLLQKIQELQEKLLETRLQLERVTNEKLTHMLSIQKIPTDKTSLRYLAPPTDTPHTSKTVFVKLAFLDPSPTIEDKGKDKFNGDVSGTQKPPSIRRSPICHHCGLSGHVRPQCSLLKVQKAKVKKEVPRQANHGTRLLTQHQAPWYQAPYQAPWRQAPRHQAPQYQAPWSHALGTRHLNISDLSYDLYLPITVANPRSNPSTLKGRRRWKMINTTESHLCGYKAWWSGWVNI